MLFFFCSYFKVTFLFAPGLLHIFLDFLDVFHTILFLMIPKESIQSLVSLSTVVLLLYGPRKLKQDKRPLLDRAGESQFEPRGNVLTGPCSDKPWTAVSAFWASSALFSQITQTPMTRGDLNIRRLRALRALTGPQERPPVFPPVARPAF